MAANRKVSDALRAEALWDKLAWQQIAEKTQRLADSLKTQVWVEQEKSALKDAQLGTQLAGLIECGEQKAALKGWATVGKVGTIVVGVAVLGVVTVGILDAVKP